MKKFVMVLVLAVVIATGTAFASHPKGTGLGVAWFYPGGVGLSLKLPSVPIFWAISMDFWTGDYNSHFNLNVSGDYYMIDDKLGGPVHWFLGIGGYFSLNTWSNTDHYYGIDHDYNGTNVAFGARVPIGISIQPIPLLEIFLDIGPHLGIVINGEQSYTYNGNKHVVNHGGAGMDGNIFFLELGLRLWF